MSRKKHKEPRTKTQCHAEKKQKKFLKNYKWLFYAKM